MTDPETAADYAGQFIMIPRGLWVDDRLTATEKLVMISLLNHVNQRTQTAWPSQKTIAEECGVKRETVCRIIRRLKMKGFLTTEHKNGTSSIYKITEPVIINHTPCDPRSPDQCATITPPVIYDHTNNNNEQEKEQEKGTIERAPRKSRAPVPPEGNDLSEKIRASAGDRARVPDNLPERLAEWSATYGAANVARCVDAALLWMSAHGTPRVDMGRFLRDWIARDAKSRERRGDGANGAKPDYGDAPPDWEEVMPAFGAWLKRREDQ